MGKNNLRSHLRGGGGGGMVGGWRVEGWWRGGDPKNSQISHVSDSD